MLLYVQKCKFFRANISTAGGTNLPPTIQASLKVHVFAELSSLVINKSLSHLASLLVLSVLSSRVDKFSLAGPNQKTKKNHERVW